MGLGAETKRAIEGQTALSNVSQRGVPLSLRMQRSRRVQHGITGAKRTTKPVEERRCTRVVDGVRNIIFFLVR